LLPEDPDNGNAVLTFSDGQLSANIDKLVNVSITNVVTKVPTNDVTFSLTLTPATGAFTGKFVHELDDGVVSPLMTDFQGVIYQKCTESGGYGYFLTRQPIPIDYTGESGKVNLIGR
jgi:hypothetical protein